MNILPLDDGGTDTLSRQGLYDRLSSGTGIGAAFEEAWTGPGSAAGLMRDFALGDAKLGTVNTDPGNRSGRLIRNAPATPEISAAEANAQFAVPGHLTFDRPVREGEARLLNGWAMQRAQREDVLMRADRGLVPGAERIGAGVLATALDPINLGASMVPVLGEGKWALQLGKLGRLGRVATGAIEGTVGTAVTEPLALIQARDQQLDYGAWDAVRNIAFGGVLGGGLHLMFGRDFQPDGKLGDTEARMQRLAKSPGAWDPRDTYRGRLTATSALVDAIPPERRALYLRSAIDDMAQGRPVDVSPLLDAEKLRVSAMNLPDYSGRLDVPTLREDGSPAVFPVDAKGDTIGFNSEIARLTTKASREGRTLELRTLPDGGKTLVETRPVDVLDQYPERAAAEAAVKRLPVNSRADLAVVPVETQARGKGFAILRGATPSQVKALEKDPSLFDKVGAESGRPTNPTFSPDAEEVRPPQPSFADQLGQAVRETIARKQAPVFDAEGAAVSARADLAAGAKPSLSPADDIAAVEKELTDLAPQLRDAEKLGQLDAEDRALMAEADEGVKAAGDFGKAAQLLANCMMGAV